MKHVSLIAAVLALLLMVSVPAYAADVVQDPLAGETSDDIPDWALKPAEDPDDTEDDPAPTPPMDPITVRDEDGNIIYQDDGTVADDPNAEEPIEEPEEEPTEETGQFLTKLFEEYTVTEGFLLLFLVLGFCLVIWKIIKGVL